MMTPLNNSFAQYGVIMEVNGNQAQVYIPLWDAETSLIPSCVTLDSTSIGHEVVVVFINGDRNQGVIVGVVQ